MSTPPSPAPTWRKSSRSSGQDTCVEVRRDLAALRDSKNATGAVVRADIAAVVADIKAGRFDV